MTDEFNPSLEKSQAAGEVWKKSRGGGWASRGFHYQHLVTTLLLVRQWAGLVPLGCFVPEGFEDCIFESRDCTVWIQIKSRKEEAFGVAEVQNIQTKLDEKVAGLPNETSNRTVIVLEEPRREKVEADVEQLFEDECPNVVLCQAPRNEILRLLSESLDIADVTIEGLLSDLYEVVAGASAENASLPYEDRRRLTATEVERRFYERLQAENPSAIDHALVSGALEPVDLVTPVHESDFYSGVKVEAGHVAANLVFERPEDVAKILDKLRRKRRVLVVGPSGAGKSALVWLSANALAGEVRWFQVTGNAALTHAAAISAFVRARRPRDRSPIGIVFDEISSANTDLWDVLIRELGRLPAVWFLGSVRQEDVNLIANQSNTEFVSVSLGSDLAQNIWEKLSARNETQWSHWREPFEQSQGLMLEYVHLLTQGKRLSAVIQDQIRLRERECRNDELKIIRSSAVLCAHAGEVAADRLFRLLDMEPDAAAGSLRRLIDEHLVRESRPGVLGGLHPLRSKALVEASHDEIVWLATNTLWESLSAATSETLPRVVQSLFADTGSERDAEVLQGLATMLSDTCTIDVWVAILTGLGLATLERHITSFVSLLEQHKLERAHWELASAFADPQLDIPELGKSEQLARLRGAVLAFRASRKRDLRSACLEQLREGSAPALCGNISEAIRLLSCLVPICGGESVEIALRYDFAAESDPDIRQIARLLSAAFLVQPRLAEDLVESRGGEDALLDLFHSRTPWTTSPVIEPHGTHGRTVRADWFLVAEQYQPDPHETVCDICEVLIALSPRSDAAASNAVDPSGQPIAIGDHRSWSKNMPRANIPAKPRVAWNVAFRQTLLARAATDTLTEYAQQMASLVRRSEKVFRALTEKWIKAKGIPNPGALSSEINEIVDSVNSLSYTVPAEPPPVMTEPGRAGTNDSLGFLLTGILSNLVWRLSTLEGAKAAATFAGKLGEQAKGHLQSGIWRTTSGAPLPDLKKLSQRLDDVSCILHEMAHNSRPGQIQEIVGSTLKAPLGGAVGAASRYCRTRARRRFADRLRGIEKALLDQGWKARCVSKPIKEGDSPYWPAKEIAVMVEVNDLETQFLGYLDKPVSVCEHGLGNDWPYRIVPIMHGQVLASLAMRPSSLMTLPDTAFASEWSDFLDRPIFTSALCDSFDRAIEACIQVSSMIVCRSGQELHVEESETASKATASFEAHYQVVADAALGTGTDEVAIARHFLEQKWNRVREESELASAGQMIQDPLCMTYTSALAGRETEHVGNIAAVRLMLLQAECGNTTVNERAQMPETT